MSLFRLSAENGFPKPKIGAPRPKGLGGIMNTTVTVINDENAKPDLDLSHVDMDEEDEIISANNQQRVRVHFYSGLDFIVRGDSRN